MHVLPAVGIALLWAPVRVGVALVALAAAAYTGFVALVFAEAVAGRPFLPGIL